MRALQLPDVSVRYRDKRFFQRTVSLVSRSLQGVSLTAPDASKPEKVILETWVG